MSKYDIPENFINRELSWIEFNQRVLDKAKDKSIPLFERSKFLGISASNLDEFLMVRVGSLKDMEKAKYKKKDIAGMTVSEQLSAISTRLHEFVKKQYSTYRQSILPKFKEEKIFEIVDIKDVTNADLIQMEEIFMRLYPLLTPMAVDFSRPFPLIKSSCIYIAALLNKPGNKKKKYELAFVKVPAQPGKGRLVQLQPTEDGVPRMIYVEDVIEKFLDHLFVPNEVVCSGAFRIIRNADLSSTTEEAEDLLKEIEKKLKKRNWGEVINLTHTQKMDKRLVKTLKKEFKVKSDDIYRVKGPLDLSSFKLIEALAKKDLRHCYPEMYPNMYEPFTGSDADIFDHLDNQDVLLYHPYDSYHSVLLFLKAAALDPKVVSIKQTLYRVSHDSPIIGALIAAAESGKDVTVLVELQARFDEESNIVWAKTLEKAGCHVIYGYDGMKTHCKLTQVVRKDDDYGYKYYTHIGTGNYNEQSAKIYTDLSFFTSNRSINTEVSGVFNMLTGFSSVGHCENLLVAPTNMKEGILKLIERETKNAKDGKPARIIMKCNSFSDKDIILALYEASQAGVTIDLIVRGICCLKPGVYGPSQNIRVISIVGRYLEHARIYTFYNDGDLEIYVGSADMMPRNLENRVEVLVKLTDEEIKNRAWWIIGAQLSDTMNAKIMMSDGSYKKIDRRGKPKVDSQDMEHNSFEE